MNVRWFLLAVLAILLFGGLISSAYASTITRALSMPRAGRQYNAQLPVTQLTTTSKGSTTIAQTGQILARDSFQRANQTLWGTATDGQNWEGDANTAPPFSIVNGLGQLAGIQGTFNAVLGPTVPASDVQVSAMASNFDGGTVNIGAVVRWNDTNNWYKALIDGSHLSIIKHIHGVGKSLTTIPFHARAGIVYTLRIRAQGATFAAKVWPTTTAEPANWMLVTSDTSLASGRGGIRIVTQNDAIVRVSTFLETAVNASGQ